MRHQLGIGPQSASRLHARALRTVDLLINSAGIAPRVRRDILEATEESYDEVMATNLKGPYFLTQQAARWMVEQQDGRIVFITSISSYTASLNRGEYCVSKAGLTMAVALYALRLATDNIKVFEIRPGVIDTDIIAPARKMYEERIAHGLFPQGESASPVTLPAWFAPLQTG